MFLIYQYDGTLFLLSQFQCQYALPLALQGGIGDVMMNEMKVEKYKVPSISTLSNLRSDLGPICDMILSAMKLYRATRWLRATIRTSYI